jgi:transcriptional regulator with XRE-family HTH domain
MARAGTASMTEQLKKERRLHEPGAVLKRLRRERGWRLAELSKRTGLPTSTLSKVENGKMSLTYDKLARISEGLGVEIASIFGEQAAASGAERRTASGAGNGRRSISRNGEGGVIDTPAYRQIFQATDLLEKKFVPLLGEIKHRSIEQFGEFIRHEGEEYSFVLEGIVEFHSDLYAPVRLYPGDSIFFDSSMGHAYIAANEGPCRVLSICAGTGVHASELQARSVALPQPPAAASAPVISRASAEKPERRATRSQAKVKGAKRR